MTTRNSFDAEKISDMAYWNASLKDKGFMFKVFWETLEHDYHTAIQLSLSNIKYAPKIRKALAEYRKAEDKCRSLLIEASKNSEKF